jgi:TPR repeat protein
MKSSILLSLLLVVLIPGGRAVAHQAPDPKQAELTGYAHLIAMSQSDLNELMAKAQSGDAEAQYWLGTAYSVGKFLPKDLKEAARWWLKSAGQGHVPAQRRYGTALLPNSPSAGERWLLQAAEQGDAEAQLWLGVAYERGSFGATNAVEALKWYRKAAEGGDPDAQVVLGQEYEDGEGVEQNYQLAAEWYRKAAEHVPNLGGAGQGSCRLGLLYMRGLGVPQDYVQAYFWFSLNGHDGNAVDAKAHLLPAEIRGTERLVKKWKEQHRVSPEVAAALHIAN